MALSENLMSKMSKHVDAYKSACEEHPDMKSFDAQLQQRTNKVIDSLTVEDATGKLSQHKVHMEVAKHLKDVTKGVADFIAGSQVNVMRNESLKKLVFAYFDNTIETLKIFEKIASCVENAEIGQLIIQEAVDEFNEESAEKDDGGRKKYENILKKLEEFKALGDPFDDQVFTTQFDLIKTQQHALFEEVTGAIKKVEKEISQKEKASLITNVLFGAVFALVAAGSIALIASGVGAAAGVASIAAFGSLAAPLTAVGWGLVYTSLDRKKDDLAKELVRLNNLLNLEKTVEEGIMTNEKATDTVSVLVEGLEHRIENELKLVDRATNTKGNEKALGRVVHLLAEKVEKLTKEIKEVGNSVEEHSKLIADARLRVQQKIISG